MSLRSPVVALVLVGFLQAQGAHGKAEAAAAALHAGGNVQVVTGTRSEKGFPE